MLKTIITCIFILITTIAHASQDYNIQEQKMLNDTLIFSIMTNNMDKSERIAQELAKQNSQYPSIRFFFYESTEKEKIPVVRFDWDKKSGLVMIFDQRTPAASGQKDSKLPEYKVLFRVRQIHNKRVYGDILVPSLSRKTPINILEHVARAISSQEKLDDITLYCTEEAYKANNSASFLKAHPNALEEGFLGLLQEEKFISNLFIRAK